MRVHGFLILAAALACTALAQPAAAVELLSDTTFANGLGGSDSSWKTFTDGAVAFSATGGVATIKKDGATSEDWASGVVYQIVDVAAGTKVKLTGTWSGSPFSGTNAKNDWWTSVSVFSLPATRVVSGVVTACALTDDPAAFGYTLEPENGATVSNGTNYSGYQHTFLTACFDYPGNFANLGANGGDFAAVTNYLNPYNADPYSNKKEDTASWSNKAIGTAQYNAADAQSHADFDWYPLYRQGTNGTDTIMSYGQVVVAVKYGSRFGNDGNVSFSNLSLSAVPEPSSFALLIAAGLGVFAYALRKRK